MPWSLTRAALLCATAAIAFTGCLQESGINTSHASTASASAPPPAAAPAVSVRAGLPDFSPLVDAVGPAVVNIAVTSVEKNSRVQISPFGSDDEDDPFSDFFRRFGIPAPGMGQGQQAQPRVQQGVGSGFIISADGYILTNAHVVENATEVTVRLTDKREFKAKVVGADKRTDVALLKIDAKGLPVVKTGNPDLARPGQWVLAMGSPFGLENTVTAGIISAKSRKLPDETYVPFIQTDVAVNPGNSGGPLINLDGEVIGINSQIYSRSGGYMGISFAIPIDVAFKVKAQLQAHGKVSRGKLGVVIQGMDGEMAQSFGLEKAAGALVNSVEAGGPAAKAGVQPGDIILEVDGARVDESSDLPRLIGDRAPGESVSLKLWREKAFRTVSVKLGEQAGDTVASAKAPKAAPGGKLGLVLREIDAREAQRLGTASGLVVEQVAGTGAGARAGIRRGDVILAVSHRRVSSAADFAAAVEAAGKHVPLLVQRGEVQQFIVVRID